MSIARERISLTSTLKDSGMLGIDLVLALDDVFVYPSGPVTSSDLTVKAFRSRTAAPVGFQRPHFHFRNAGHRTVYHQRLLGDEEYGTWSNGMHLVIDQVVQSGRCL